MSMSGSMRIVVLEDDADLRDSLVELLNIEGFIADGVSSLSRYRAWMSTHSCEVLIADRSLEDGDGLEAVAHFKTSTDGFALVLSAFSDLEDRVEGIRNDVDGYLAKPYDWEELRELLLAFQRRAKRSGGGSRWILDPIGWTLMSPAGRLVSLTRAQVAILANFVEKPGITVTKADLIGSLGGKAEFFDPKRLEAAMRRLRVKINDTLGVELPIEAVYGQGYSFKAVLAKL